MHTFTVQTQQHTQFINIDAEVRRIIREANLDNGLLQLHVPHTTAGITINENADPDVPHDIEYALDKAVPWRDAAYRHNEENSAAHVKASMMGSGLTLIIRNGMPQLGTWQSVFFCEFDGPRNRQVWALPLETKEQD
ncbi:MAG TPA: YjbQ family protein [Candidatus Hydrogenedentes bacterium]|nr:YjbQ family protein [Candidatus Hydrogenedentota bacterium]